MTTMSYVLFQETLKDLKKCKDKLFDDLDGSEKSARYKMVMLCREIISDWDDQDEEELEPDEVEE